MDNSYLQKVEHLKKDFIDKYNVIMYCLLISFIIIFYFFIPNSAITLYLIGGLLFLAYSYFLVRGKYSANQIIHSYMILGPIYNCYIIITFWNNSIATFVTLFPLILAAYVFFSKREVIAYSIYLVMNIVTCFIICEYFDLHPIKSQRHEVIICDTILFGFNLIIIILILIYHGKINKVIMLSDVRSQEFEMENKNSIQKKLDDKENINEEIAESVFVRLENIMDNEKLFKNSKLDISMLSINLGVNYAYLSKVIRYKGYTNFSSYLNIYRINYVKKLINVSDLQKVTLMYIYTEAGFSSQATFNRVFKQIEGITPSEYISGSFNQDRLN